MAITVVQRVLLCGMTLSASLAWAAPSPRTPSASEQAQSYFQEGYRHQQAERYKDAIDTYERSLSYDPKQAEALNNVGFCYKSLKQFQRAITYYKDALSIDPNLAEAHEYLGEAYLGVGKIDLAKREYATLLRLDPEEAKELLEKIEAAQTPDQASEEDEE